MCYDHPPVSELPPAAQAAREAPGELTALPAALAALTVAFSMWECGLETRACLATDIAVWTARRLRYKTGIYEATYACAVVAVRLAGLRRARRLYTPSKCESPRRQSLRSRDSATARPPNYPSKYTSTTGRPRCVLVP